MIHRVRGLEGREPVALRQRAFLERLVRDVRVVEREALRQAGRSPQQERRHGRARAEAAVAKQARHRSRLILQREAPLVANAVVERKLAGDSAACAGSVCGECVYARSKTMPRVARASMFGVASGRPAVRRQPIGAQAVNRDQHDRTLMRRRFARKSPARERGAGDREDEQRDDDGRLPALSRGRHAGAPLTF